MTHSPETGTIFQGTHEDERIVLYRTNLLDGTKPNTNPKINLNPNTNPNPNPITNPIQFFYAFFEHRPLIFSLAIFWYHFPGRLSQA